jgi:hypothetical protein
MLENFRKSLILGCPSAFSVELEEREREGTMLQVLILENVMPGLEAIGMPKLVELGYRQTLFKHILSICAQRTFCSKCSFCEVCKTNSERSSKMTAVMRGWLEKLFEFEKDTK